MDVTKIETADDAVRVILDNSWLSESEAASLVERLWSAKAARVRSGAEVVEARRIARAAAGAPAKAHKAGPPGLRPYPAGFKLNDQRRRAAIAKGVPADKVDGLFSEFEDYNTRNRRKAANWDRQWSGWVDNRCAQYPTLRH